MTARNSDRLADPVAINVVLALLDLEKSDVADELGLPPGYVRQVLTGFVRPSREFQDRFLEILRSRLFRRASSSRCGISRRAS